MNIIGQPKTNSVTVKKKSNWNLLVQIPRLYELRKLF